MVKSGDVITNPVTGERMVFRLGPEETKGELLQFDHFLRIGGHGPPPHIHPRQEERFVCVQGRMTVLRGEEEITLEAGETLVVPPGVVHTWWNVGDVELYQITEFRPALRFDCFLVRIAELGRKGQLRLDRLTFPYIMQFATLSGTLPETVYVASPPPWVQRLLFPVLAPIGRMLGYKVDYSEADGVTERGIVPVLPESLQRLTQPERSSANAAR